MMCNLMFSKSLASRSVTSPCECHPIRTAPTSPPVMPLYEGTEVTFVLQMLVFSHLINTEANRLS